MLCAGQFSALTAESGWHCNDCDPGYYTGSEDAKTATSCSLCEPGAKAFATDQLHVASRLSFAKLGWSCAVCMRRSFAVCCHQSLQAIIMASKHNLPVFRATKCEGGTDTHTQAHAHAHTSVVRCLSWCGSVQLWFALQPSSQQSSETAT